MPGDACDPVAALEAAACLGAWVHDPSADRVYVDAPLGDLLGLAPDERAGAPLARMLSGLHAEDRPRAEAVLAAARETGGRFEAEFRTRGARGMHVLRLMGRTEAAGRTPRTRGLAFDLTEIQLGRGSPLLRAQWQANQIAGHVIAMRGLVAALGNPSLARLLDRLAVEAGFELARRLGQAGGGVRH